MEEIKLQENETVDAVEIKNPSAVIEAIMFAAGYPMKYEKLAETLNEIAREKYPRFTTNTEENKSKNQGSFF